VIRLWRQDVTSETGTPFRAAVRIMDTGSPRRRWELMMYPKPAETLTAQFPYLIHFDSLTTGTDVQPAPFSFDETVKAACLAQAEKERDDALGINWDYYRNTALPAAYRINASMAPRKLGGTHGPRSIRDFRNNWYQRPTVTFNP
jgi:hypothetical protein